MKTEVHYAAKTLFLLGLSVFCGLSFWYYALYPTVFSDEWLYSRSARLMPLSLSNVPSYLFLALFKQTQYCGSHFLLCARELNLILFVASAPFIFSVANRILRAPHLAIFVTAFALIDPIHSYTAYFMPEAFYYLMFWIWASLILKINPTNTMRVGIGAGCLLGVMANIKVHALFLIFAFAGYLLLLSRRKSPIFSLKKSLFSLISCIVCYVFVRYSIAYSITGQINANLVGEKYLYNFQSIFQTSHLNFILHHLGIPLLGHAAALTLFFSIPLLALLRLFQHASIENENITKCYALSFACLTVLLSVTVITTTQIVGWDVYETINRLHFRYYNFVFPLFLIIAAAETQTVTPNLSNRIIVITPFIILTLYALLFFTNGYSISYIDAPELYGIVHHTNLFLIIGLANIAMLVFIYYKQMLIKQFYFFIYLPLILIVSAYTVNSTLHKERLFADSYDEAGIFGAHNLRNESSQLVVVGEEPAGLAKTLFYIDNIKTISRTLAAGVPLEFASIPPNAEWILLIGEHPILGKWQIEKETKSYKLIKV